MKVDYTIETRNNNGTRDIIIFNDNTQHEPFWYFLNDEVGQFEAWIKDNLRDVILTQEEKTIRGNVCTAVIAPGRTTIIDNYAEEAGKKTDRCVVDTRKLLQAVNWWSDFVREWKRTGEKESVHGMTGELDL